jgi:hypothetical protein
VIRTFVFVAVIILARVAAGPAAAAIAAFLLALGACLRVRLADGVVGLSVFGIVVAALGGVSLRLALAFWTTGLAIIALRTLISRVRRGASQSPLSGLRDGSTVSPS